jgi:ATPase subunit of ABC transporter with duplicated ATPase domains
MVELNRIYPEGSLRVHGNYSEFLEKKEEFLHAQSKRQEALENLVHGEIEWLRRGAKARTRKSKARISKAGELMGELADLNARTRSTTAQIDFSATDRKTKRLIELQNVTYSVGVNTSRATNRNRHNRTTRPRALFEGLNFILTCRNARWPRRSEWQRQDDSAALAAGRPRSRRR